MSSNRHAGDIARQAAVDDGLPVAWTQADAERAIRDDPRRPVLLRGDGEFFLDEGNAWTADAVTAYAIGRADVAAFDQSTVFAADAVHVMAQDEAHVRLVGAASCWTAGEPTVEARDHSTVAVWRGGSVAAHDEATVVFADEQG